MREGKVRFKRDGRRCEMFCDTIWSAFSCSFNALRFRCIRGELMLLSFRSRRVLLWMKADQFEAEQNFFFASIRWFSGSRLLLVLLHFHFPFRSSISTRRHGKFSWSQWGKWKWRKLDFLFFLLSFFWFSYSSFRRQVTLRRRMKKSLARKSEKEKFVNWVFKGD